jgi:geranylgeranyl pyrophosphate synthase
VGPLTFHAAWEEARRRVDARVEALLVEEPAALREALGPALHGGKRLRPAILLLVHDALGGAERERAERWALGIELVHAATLIHDDLVDGDAWRRGAPAVHAALARSLADRAAEPGARTTAGGLACLAGDAALAHGVGLLDDPAAQRLLAQALRAVWLGAWQEALPTGGASAERVAEGKTASLFRLAAALGAMAARGTAEQCEAAGRYGHHLGMAYQWADDALDLPRPGESPALLRERAAHEAAHARRVAHAFPPGAAGAALRDAPGEIVAAVLAPLAEAAP